MDRIQNICVFLWILPRHSLTPKILRHVNPVSCTKIHKLKRIQKMSRILTSQKTIRHAKLLDNFSPRPIFLVHRDSSNLLGPDSPKNRILVEKWKKWGWCFQIWSGVSSPFFFIYHGCEHDIWMASFFIL